MLHVLLIVIVGCSFRDPGSATVMAVVYLMFLSTLFLPSNIYNIITTKIIEFEERISRCGGVLNALYIRNYKRPTVNIQET